MQGSRSGFALALLFAFLVVRAPGIAAAQDMPPILAPLAAAPTTPTVAPKPAPITPSAEAVIPPAASASVAKPVDKPHVVAIAHPPVAHQNTKFTALVKHLTTAHSHVETHHAAAPHHIAETHRVAARVIEPSLPPGMPVPPPGYYEPGYSPGPYQRLVYGGPPPGLYGGWGGYRGRLPYYP
jgi:hypothetical protein